ncbi:putative inorganic phosphate transporter 1-11 [Capsicum annuum]|nr:putative inorganic phosphate transporter 1-11 [Capsicum annuum]
MKVAEMSMLRWMCGRTMRDRIRKEQYSRQVRTWKKRGDKKVLFADRVLKFTSTGKMKRHILLITDFALYIVDPDIDALKRRISLAAVEKLCLSERSDNFLAIIAPTEYDLLIASTRKTEIVSIFVDTTRSQSDYELEVLSSNRFEYNATSELVKEIYFDETEEFKLLRSWTPIVMSLLSLSICKETSKVSHWKLPKSTPQELQDTPTSQPVSTFIAV